MADSLDILKRNDADQERADRLAAIGVALQQVPDEGPAAAPAEAAVEKPAAPTQAPVQSHLQALASGLAHGGLNSLSAVMGLGKYASEALGSDTADPSSVAAGFADKQDTLAEQNKLVSDTYNDANPSGKFSDAGLKLAGHIIGAAPVALAGGGITRLVPASVAGGAKTALAGQLAFDPHEQTLASHLSGSGIPGLEDLGSLLTVRNGDSEIAARLKHVPDALAAGAAFHVMGAAAKNVWARFHFGGGATEPGSAIDTGAAPSAMQGEQRVPEHILAAAQDLNYARAFKKDLEAQVSTLPQQATTPEAASQAGAALKVARSEASNIVNDARARWEAAKAHPEFGGLRPTQQAEMHALAEGGQARLVVTPDTQAELDTLRQAGANVKTATSRSSGATTVSPSELDSAVEATFGSRNRMAAARKQANAVSESPEAVKHTIASWRGRVIPFRSLNEAFANSNLADLALLSKKMVTDFTQLSVGNIKDGIDTLLSRRPEVGLAAASNEALHEVAARFHATVRGAALIARTAMGALRNSEDGVSKFVSTDPAYAGGQNVARAFRTQSAQLLNPEVAAGDTMIGLPAATTHGVGTLLTLPRRMVLTADEFAQNTVYYQNMQARAYMEGWKKGLTGDALQQFMDSAPANLSDETMQAIEAESKQKALDYTFHSPLGPIAAPFEKWLNAMPGARLVVPFFRIPTNIVKTGLSYDPLVNITHAVISKEGFFRKMMTEGRAAAMQSPEGRDFMARMAIGGSIWTAVGSMVSQDRLTGAAPTDPGERARWEADGRKEYSVKLGDTWYSYHAVEPFALTMGMAANVMNGYADVYEHDPDQATAAMQAIAVGFAHTLRDHNVAKGLSRAYDAFANIETKGLNYGADVASGFVPKFVRKAGQHLDLWDTLNTDNNVHDPAAYKATGEIDRLQTAWNRVLMNTGFGAGLPVRYSLMGPVKRSVDAGWDGMSPFAKSETHDAKFDPLLHEVSRLNARGSKPPVDWGDEMRSIAGGYNLMPQERSDLGKFLTDFKPDGKTIAEHALELVQSDGYKALSENSPNGAFAGGKQTALANLVHAYLTAGKNSWLATRPDVQTKVQQKRQAKAAAVTGTVPTDPTVRALLGER